MKLRHRYMEEANGDGGNGGGAGGGGSDGAAGGVSVINDWRDGLSPELRDDPSLADFKDLGSLAQAYRDTKAMVGQSVRIPTQEAGEADIKAFVDRILENNHVGLMPRPDPENPDSMAHLHKMLGVPEEVGGYQAPEGVDATAFGALATKAKELGIPKKAFEELSSAQAQLYGSQMEQMNTERVNGVNQLKGEWGPAFDEKSARAHHLAKTMGHEMLAEAIEGKTVDAVTLRFLDKIATQLGAEGAPMANQFGGAQQETVAEMEQRRNEITRRMQTEDMSAREYTMLQNRLLELSGKIAAARQ